MQQFKPVDRCGRTDLLEEKHGCKTCGQCNKAVEELRYGEALSVFCQKRDGCVTVLGYAAGKKDWERNDSSRKQGHEYHVRSGLWNDADQGRKKDHEDGVVAYPPVDVDILKANSENEKHSECPCEYGREMFLYNMAPEMFFDKMVRGKEQDEKHDDTESCEKYIHPVFAEEVYVECSRRFFMMRMIMVLTCFSMDMPFVTSVSFMVMSEMSGS